MKKIALMTALVAAGITNVYAVDGTITINGEVTDKTCDIVSGANGNMDVTLPTVSKSALKVAGDTVGRTPFQIKLENCTAGASVATYFEPGPTVDFNSGRLINTDTAGATNVNVQLVGDNGNPILVKGVDAATGLQTNSQKVDVSAAGTADLNYYAEYYATGAATAGIVTTSVKYTIIYP